ncbi:TNT domain-containing protein [Mucilaginibacter sp.]|uniref:TNT domain-containing protein n=1 Tax=Mucilaginibacter sp. TaxID=1882438 RepID=UPI00284A8D07|nr:TNT domain-containing protein [Mucilaginibacter sp.]MDR3697478.1 TNT domain-containing protein [Mucilaginibacter sp.]
MKTLKIFVLAALLLPFAAKAQTIRAQKHHPGDSLVRGVSYKAFQASVTLFLDSAKKPLLDSSWNLWKAEKWAALEHFFTIDSLNGGWPPNSGALSLRIVKLDSGVLIDRYGGYYVVDSIKHDSVFHDRGKFVCFKGVPFPKRALPQSALKSPYRLYRVIKAIADIKRGGIIPWFNEPGLGIQFEMPVNIDALKQGGYIVEVSSKPPN